jgi:hypothetical protein
MNTPRTKIWFPAKQYGFGWGLPVCWQGWVVILAFGFFYIAGGFVILRTKEASAYFPWFGVGGFLIYMSIFWLKGEKLKWRWGKKDDDDTHVR